MWICKSGQKGLSTIVVIKCMIYPKQRQEKYSFALLNRTVGFCAVAPDVVRLITYFVLQIVISYWGVSLKLKVICSCFFVECKKLVNCFVTGVKNSGARLCKSHRAPGSVVKVLWIRAELYVHRFYWCKNLINYTSLKLP